MSSSISSLPSSPSHPCSQTANTSSLSLFVLLPASAHSNYTTASSQSATRPPPLVSRLSGSSVHTLKSLTSTKTTDEPSMIGGTDSTPEIDKVVSAGRRLSLAPGIGGGTLLKQGMIDLNSPSLAHRTPSTIAFDMPLDEEPSPTTANGPKPFGAKSLFSGRSKRRPQTASTTASPISSAFGAVSRGSIAGPSSSSGTKSRPGWEGDELVGVLRGSGLEVTIIRHASQVSSILSPSTSSPRIGSFTNKPLASRPRTPSAVTPVILVPLSDSPTLPSLSLLLKQGTTPTAVCFQQDLLDRAKRSEDEWLPSALQQIKTVTEMRTRSMQESSEIYGTGKDQLEAPVILAYSANPTISTATIAACVNAGASGVLKPPFDIETARFLRRMVRAAKEGRLSSVVQLPTAPGVQRPLSPTLEEASDYTTVVLPPTALSTGGEHEGEKVLTGALHRRGTSGSWDGRLSRPADTISRKREITAPVRRGQESFLSPAVLKAPTTSHHNNSASQGPTSPRQALLDDKHNLASLFVYDPSTQPRRRSVDTSGLGFALRRAEHAFEVVPVSGGAMSHDDMDIDHRHEEGNDHDCHDTHLAELLSTMFYQTQLAIEIDMDEYARFAAPISSAHRARLVDALATWEFKPHNLDDGDLFRAACILFDGLLSSEGLYELQLDRDQFYRLLFAIRAIYHAPNPYHNYVHAIDVLQATYSFLAAIGVAPPFSHIRDMSPATVPWTRPGEQDCPSYGPGSRRAKQVFRPQDVFAIVVAAMGHDVGHPGLSNAFMKNAKTPLSQVYDDKSVLENMHCMLVVQLLRKHGFGFLINPTPVGSTETIPARASFDYKGFRHVLYSTVLATDMSLHFVWMQNLQNFGEKISQETGIYGKNKIGPGMARDEDVEADRIMIAQAVIKCADISNPTRPIDVSEYWSTVLLKEWAVQASLETDLELPVSVIASADAALQAKGQIGFIKLFTQPLFDAVSDVLPEMQCYADWCEENHGLWEARSEDLKTQPQTAVVQPAIADAAHDDRFATLFPLSLPVSLVASQSLEPGPSPSSAPPATPIRKHRPTDGCMKHAESPTARAIRAVYHSNLLDQRPRLSSWSRGVPIPGVDAQAYLETRRSSTPGFMKFEQSFSPVGAR